MDLQNLGVAALGSIIGFLAREIISLVRSKIDFERNLIILTYQRKLEIAEKAISYFYNLRQSISSLKLSYGVISENFASEENPDLSIDFIYDIVKTHQSIIEKLQDQNYNIFSLNLYFDIEDDDNWHDSDNAELIISGSKLAHNTEILNELFIRYQKYEKDKNELEMEKIYDDMEKTITEHKLILKNYTIILEKTESFYAETIKKIKLKIKTY
jgi:hypothetical protein